MASDNLEGRISRAIKYVIRHWRGELDLAQTFHVNFLIPLALFIVIISGFYNISVFASLRSLAATFVAVVGLQGVIFIWMLVGTWRSASREVYRRGSGWYASWVRVALSVSVIVFIAFGFTDFLTMAKIAFGNDPFNKYVIERTGPDEIMIRGLIGSSLPGKLAPILEQTVVEQREVRWLRLESQGGRVGAALEVAYLIADLDLNVRVWDECSSACVLAFMGSDLRVLGRNAKIGLHAYSPEVGGFSVRGEMERDRRYMAARGVSEAFLDKAFSTPPDDMWYPSFEELVEAGVVTHVMEGGETRPVRPE